MADIAEIKDALKYIDCSSLNYADWIEIGMALHSEGVSCDVWDEWSRTDPARYDGSCESHWKSFQDSGITINSLFRRAYDNGFQGDYRVKSTEPGHELSEDETVLLSGGNALPVLDKALIEREKCPTAPKNWRPLEDLREYIGALFNPDEHVSYCVESYEGKDGKRHPGNRVYDRTAGRLLEELEQARTVEDVFGTYNPEVGAWVNHNPVDGTGAKKTNITSYRHLLIESDEQDIDTQYTLMVGKGGLELPIAALVYSGNKSLHAIVKVDANSAREYTQRVDKIYSICEKNGLKVDHSTKDPSRLSRLPGFTRNGKQQYLIATNIGRESYAKWLDYIETVDDDLPDPIVFDQVMDNLPPLAPALIDGVLRQGHKMLISGPSKAGKSFALIELCIAIAEGKPWISWPCAQGKVLYVNLELDPSSCLRRFADVYAALGLPRRSPQNIVIWNLRGQILTMEKLTPRLVKRARDQNYIAIVIDPIYKVLTGDENSAEQMSRFCSYFDKIAADLHCSVIYCHHHSKGAQGNKNSSDRSSGSGVFARDPDAIMDWIELPMDDGNYSSLEDVRICIDTMNLITLHNPAYLPAISDDDTKSAAQMQKHARTALRQVFDQRTADNTVDQAAEAARTKARQMTGWRTEMTLREFPKPAQTDIFFDYPIHRADTIGRLKNLEPAGTMPRWEKPKPKSEDQKLDAKIKKDKEKNNAYLTRLQLEFENLDTGSGIVTLQDLADAVGVAHTAPKFREAVERLIENFGFTKTKLKVNGQGQAKTALMKSEKA